MKCELRGRWKHDKWHGLLTNPRKIFIVDYMARTYSVHDSYFKKAKHEGYKARSVFKLQEIDQKYHLFQEGDAVLDMGSFPGSFLQYISKRIGPSGIAIGVDIQKMSLREQNVQTYVYNILSPEFSEFVRAKNFVFDVITSDAAPSTSGVKEVDHARSMELCERVLEIARQSLCAGGWLLMKMFVGSDFHEFHGMLKEEFQTVRTIKPKASARSKKEVYLLGMGKS